MLTEAVSVARHQAHQAVRESNDPIVGTFLSQEAERLDKAFALFGYDATDADNGVSEERG